MLEQSDIPLFLCKRLCLDVGLYFYFSFSLENHTLLNVGLKKEISINLSLLDIAINKSVHHHTFDSPY